MGRGVFFRVTNGWSKLETVKLKLLKHQKNQKDTSNGIKDTFKNRRARGHQETYTVLMGM